MSANRLADAERTAMVGMLREGASVRSVARALRRSPATVSAVAHAAGIEPNVQATKKATEAGRDYALAARLVLLNRLFDKAGDLIAACSKPADLQSLSVAVATLIDKRRLEDGEATSRAEVNATDARDRIARKLDELAARRRAKGAA